MVALSAPMPEPRAKFPKSAKAPVADYRVRSGRSEIYVCGFQPLRTGATKTTGKSKNRRGANSTHPDSRHREAPCTESTPSRARLGACSVEFCAGLENSRFSSQPVAEATQILMFYSLDNVSDDRRTLTDAAGLVQQIKGTRPKKE